MRGACSLAAALVLWAALPAGARAEMAPPRVPCAAGIAPLPAYAAVGAAPAVAVWHDIDLAGEAGGEAGGGTACLGRLTGRFDTAVAIAARFRHGGTLDDLAARAGAVSRTAGLHYWSASEQKWRTLVTAAAALDGTDQGPDPAWEDGGGRRQDFTAAELRAGVQLWSVQNDTRSLGDNLYSLRATLSAPDRLAVEVVNESAIGFFVMTLFEPRELLALHVIEHLGGDLWGYYGLAAVRGAPPQGFEASLVNRLAAYYRFLRGVPGDAEAPLAR
ncbi:MAG: DUF6675 family protein [Bacteroidota bacterium]